jgi:hypothetical protein
MKKWGLIFWCVVLAGLAGCKKEAVTPIPELAQGYGEVKWGSPVETVREAYNIGEEIEVKTDADDSNITTLTQNNVSDNMALRVFYFNDDKLYRVRVEYPQRVDHERLIWALTEKYGSFSYMMTLGLDEAIFGFNQYSPDIEIMATFYFSGRNNHTVVYSWAEFRNTYMISKTEKIEL